MKMVFTRYLLGALWVLLVAGCAPVSQDMQKPVITLLGNAEVNLTVGEQYKDAGATATDDVDGNITDKIQIVSDVNISQEGNYTAIYNVSDAAGNAADPVKRTVRVKPVPDTTKPVITLIGNSEVNLTVGEQYKDAGATATDDVDGNLTKEIQVTSYVNISQEGNYIVTYNVSDAAGNSADEVSRIVNVKEKDAAQKEYGKAGTHPTAHYDKVDTNRTTVYYPTDLPEGKKVPVIFFSPGWNNSDTPYSSSQYTSLLTFMASHGYYVIYLRQGWLANSAIPAYQAMLDENKDHIDTTRIGVVGHSLGGGNTFKILDYFFKEKGYGEDGRFIMVIEGWFAWQMNQEDMKSLPANTNLIMQQYGPKGNNAVNDTDPRIVLTEYYMLDSIPDNQKDYQVYDDEGVNHRYPYGDRDYSDMQIILKPLDALMDYTFNGTAAAHDIALEVGNDDPYAEGNGIQEVKPIADYHNKCDENVSVAIDYCDMAQWYYKKQLILHQKGHWLPMMADNFASRAAYINTLPFSGFTMVGNTYTHKVMESNTSLLSYDTIWDEVKAVKDLYPTKSNFLTVDMHFPGDFWKDAVWNNVIANFGTLAKVAKDLGFRGIIYDNEAYHKDPDNKMINYDKEEGARYDDAEHVSYKNPYHTFAEHSAKITSLFKRIMEAMVSEYPAIDVLYYHSPVLGHIKADRGIVGEDGKKHPVVVDSSLERSHEWQGAMFVGLKKGLSHQATLHDMGEDYRLRTQKHFDDAYEWRKHTIASDATNDTVKDATQHWIVPQEERATWAKETHVNFMVSNEPLKSDDYPEFDTTNKVGLNDMKTTFERALDKSDNYVVFFSASSSDKKGGRIPLDWLNDPATHADNNSSYSLDPDWKAMLENVYTHKVLK